MKEVGDFFRKRMQRPVPRHVVLVLLLLQSLDQDLPHPTQIDVSDIASPHTRSAPQAFISKDIPVLAQHVFPWRTRLAGHAVPHVEFVDCLLKCDLKPNLRLRIEFHEAIDYLKQRSVDIPHDSTDARDGL